MLAVSLRPLTVDEVAEAILVDYENEQFDPDLQRLRDPLYVIKICRGLVVAQENTYSLFVTRLI